jgi:hypothetical protein
MNIVGVAQEVVNLGVGKGSGVVVEGIKYGCYDPSKANLSEVNAGDTIEFMYQEKGKYTNVTGRISVRSKHAGAPIPPTPAPASSAPPRKGGWAFPIPALDGQRAIVRQNSVTNATNLVGKLLSLDGDVLPDLDIATRIVAIAKVFEEYSTGDLDAKLADEAMKEINGS